MWYPFIIHYISLHCGEKRCLLTGFTVEISKTLSTRIMHFGSLDTCFLLLCLFLHYLRYAYSLPMISWRSSSWVCLGTWFTSIGRTMTFSRLVYVFAREIFDGCFVGTPRVTIAGIKDIWAALHTTDLISSHTFRQSIYGWMWPTTRAHCRNSGHAPLVDVSAWCARNGLRQPWWARLSVSPE